MNIPKYIRSAKTIVLSVAVTGCKTRYPTVTKPDINLLKPEFYI